MLGVKKLSKKQDNQNLFKMNMPKTNFDKVNDFIKVKKFYIQKKIF